MKKIVCFFGRQGFGKTTLSQLYARRGGHIFHVGVFLKQPEKYSQYLSSQEILYIKDLRNQVDNLITDGQLCCINKVDELISKIILSLSKNQNVYTDGYPRTIEQARWLVAACKQNNIELTAIQIKYSFDDDLQDYVSFCRQYLRDMTRPGYDPMNQIIRYRNKLSAYHTETEKALEYFISSNIPISTLYIGKQNYIHNSMQFPFDSIVDLDSGEKQFANEFFFYPANVNDYAQCYYNPSTDKYPVMVTITLMNKCTDKCVGCFNSSYISNEYLDINVLESLIDDLADHGTVAIKAAGREPTCYPYLDRFIKKCNERHLQCVIITSGANIDKWEHVLSQSCDHLRISLNAFSEESHTKYHRPSKEAISFSERLKIVERLAKERRSRNLTTGVSFLIRDGNEAELPLLIDFCRKCGFTYLRFSEINYFSKHRIADDMFIKEMENLSTPDFTVKYHEQYQTVCEKVNSSIFTCPALLSRSVILANGDVISCHSALDLANHNYPSIYGNINQSSFYQIWCGQQRRDFIQRMNREMQDKFIQLGYYVCDKTNCCSHCKYSGFNHISRWIANHGSNVAESYWRELL